MSDWHESHGLHTWLSCPAQSPGACSNVHWVGDAIPTILSFVISFSSCLQSFAASRSFLINWLFASCGQSIRASASASILPMNIQNSFRVDWFDLLAVQGTLKSLLQHHSSKSWQLTLVFLPRKSQEQRSLVGYSSWGCKWSDMTEHLNLYNMTEYFVLYCIVMVH